jgi:hypothetical protein
MRSAFLAGGLLVVLGLVAPDLSRAAEKERDRGPGIGQAGEAGEADEAGESSELLDLMEYWHARLTYPTGRFDRRWLIEAAEQDARIARTIPRGRPRDTSESPLNLDPTQFTSLGPKPLQSNGCLGCFPYGHVAGRTNVIVIDPRDAQRRLPGQRGRRRVEDHQTAASTATTWAVTTDDPLVSTSSIDDLVLDPNDHNVVYAGTGDLNFGSLLHGHRRDSQEHRPGRDVDRPRVHRLPAQLPEPPGSSAVSGGGEGACGPRGTPASSSRAPRRACSSPTTRA